MATVVLDLGDDRDKVVTSLYNLTDLLVGGDVDNDTMRSIEETIVTVDRAIEGNQGNGEEGDRAIFAALQTWMKAINQVLGVTPMTSEQVAQKTADGVDLPVFKVMGVEYHHPQAVPSNRDFMEYQDLRFTGEWPDIREKVVTLSGEILNHPNAPESDVYNVVKSRVGLAIQDMETAVTNQSDRDLTDAFTAWLISVNMLRFQTGTQYRVLSVDVIDVETGVSTVAYL